MGVIIVEGKVSFGGEVWASHCNQWGHCCVVVWKCMNWSSCHLAWWVGEPRHWWMKWGSTCLKGKGYILALFAPTGPMVSMVWFLTEMYSTRAQYTTGIYVSLAFWRYSQVRCQCWVLREVCKNETVDTHKMDIPLHGAAEWYHDVDHHCQIIFGAYCQM